MRSSPVVCRMMKFQRIRKELLRGLSQEAIAKRTSLTTRTYAHAEDGKPVKYSSALEILDAVNTLLTEYGANAVTLDDLTLTIE
jgi:DNA-binding XRE family transcriptional regulator